MQCMTFDGQYMSDERLEKLIVRCLAFWKEAPFLIGCVIYCPLKTLHIAFEFSGIKVLELIRTCHQVVHIYVQRHVWNDVGIREFRDVCSA